MSRNHSVILLTLAAAALAGCSHRISRDQARSEIRQTVSLAAESEMFIDFVLQGHATRSYAEQHAAYLEQAVEQSAKELEQAQPEPGSEDALRECRTQLRLLGRQLAAIQSSISDNAALVAAREKIKQIGKNAAEANSHL